MNDDIEILNRRLGDALGRPNGTDPRFAWKESQDLFFYARRHELEEYTKFSWAQRIGKCWVLCQWRPPETTIHGVTIPLTADSWHTMFKGRRPFPAKGEYKVHSETKLAPGAVPTAEWTQFYIKTLGQQMEAAELAQKEEFAGRKDAVTEQCESEANDEVDQAFDRFYESAREWQPASWRLGEPQPFGSHDGPIAYQVGGSRDDISSNS